MKILSYFFFSTVGAIAVCLTMSIVTSLHQERAKKAAESAPLSIPLPAEASHPGTPSGH